MIRKFEKAFLRNNKFIDAHSICRSRRYPYESRYFFADMLIFNEKYLPELKKSVTHTRINNEHTKISNESIR